MLVNTLGADIVPVGGGLGNAPDLIAALDAAVRARILRKTTGAAGGAGTGVGGRGPGWRRSGREVDLWLKVLLEVCVDDPTGLAEAVAGGADRIELCAALGIWRPDPQLWADATGGALRPVPCYPMIRPRSGDFVFTAAEVAVMKADIRAARAAGLTGVVLGASRPDGTLDEALLAALIAEAAGLDLTLHRAIDLCPDTPAAVRDAKRLAFAASSPPAAR